MWFLLSENKPVVWSVTSQPLSAGRVVTAQASPTQAHWLQGWDARPPSPAPGCPHASSPQQLPGAERATLAASASPLPSAGWASSPTGAAGWHLLPTSPPRPALVPQLGLGGHRSPSLLFPAPHSCPVAPQMQTGSCPSPAPILHSATHSQTARPMLRAPTIQAYQHF